MKRLIILATVLCFAAPSLASACGAGVAYNGKCYIALTSGTSWTVPSDWNNGANDEYAIGAGGAGDNALFGGGAVAASSRTRAILHSPARSRIRSARPAARQAQEQARRPTPGSTTVQP